MKLNKKLLPGVIGALCIFVLNTPANADNTQTQTTAEEMTSEADYGPTYSVNPERPGETEGNQPVMGDLAIVSVSKFNFGEVGEATGLGRHFIQKNEMPNVQVVDLRGSSAGWILNAQLSPLVSAETAQASEENLDKMEGAYIMIQNGRLNSTESMEGAPSERTNVRLDAEDVPVQVLVADSGKGNGLWVNRFYPDLQEAGADSYVSLVIPKIFVELGAYNGTITWSLVNGF